MAKFNIDNMVKAKIINQQQANQMSQFNAGQSNELSRLQTDIAGRIATTTIGANASVASAQIGANASMSNAAIAARTQTFLGQLDNQTRLTMQGIGNEFQTTIEGNRAAYAVFSNGAQAIASINTDTRLSDAARTTAVTNYMHGMRNALGLIGVTSNVPNIDQFVNFAGPAANSTGTSSAPTGLLPTDTVVTNPDGSQTITHADGTKEVRPNPNAGGGYNPGGGGDRGGGDRGGWSDTSGG